MACFTFYSLLVVLHIAQCMNALPITPSLSKPSSEKPKQAGTLCDTAWFLYPSGNAALHSRQFHTAYSFIQMGVLFRVGCHAQGYEMGFSFDSKQ